jgi:hypothetical protein
MENSFLFGRKGRIGSMNLNFVLVSSSCRVPGKAWFILCLSKARAIFQVFSGGVPEQPRAGRDRMAAAWRADAAT